MESYNMLPFGIASFSPMIIFLGKDPDNSFSFDKEDFQVGGGKG